MSVDIGKGSRVLLLLSALVIVLAGFRLAAPLLVPLLLAVFIAIVTMPIVKALSNRGVPVQLAVIAAFLMDVACLVALGFLLALSVDKLSASLPAYQQRAVELTESLTVWFSGYGIQVAASSLIEAVDPASAMGFAMDTLKGVLLLLSMWLLVLLVVMFILFEAAGFEAKVREAFGQTRYTKARFASAMHDIQKYLVIKTISSLTTGLLVYFWVRIADLDGARLWGVLAFLLNYVPTLGSILAAVPAVLLAVLQHGFASATFVASGYIVINFVIGNLIEPRVFGRVVGLSPLVVFLSMVFWGWILGPIGAFLSVPLTMIVRITLANTEDLRWVAVLLGPSGKRCMDGLRPSMLPPKLTQHVGE